MQTDISDADQSVIASILANHFNYQGDFSATRLGGLTNYNYLVQAGDLNAVFRLPGDGTEGLVDREVECAITKAASSIGVDSPLLYFDPATGIKAVQLIPHANTMSKEKLQQPDNTVRAAKLIRKLHDEGASVDFRFDVFEMIPHYEELIEQHESIDWEGYGALREQLMAIKPQLQANSLALCHCDPLCENFVLDAESGRMYLIDWEYGGMNDPLWDVADVIIESDYNRNQRDLFQESYFGRAATAEEDRMISAYIVLIDFLWALWGKQRSYFDHSLDYYGPERFARAQRNYETLLGQDGAGA